MTKKLASMYMKKHFILFDKKKNFFAKKLFLKKVKHNGERKDD